VGFWWAVAPEAERLRASETIDDWDPNFGDRRQEIAIIGIDMDETSLRRRLDACLLTDAEMARGIRAWRRFPDPFPQWRVAAADAADAVLQ
jgi:hypothetical protein